MKKLIEKILSKISVLSGRKKNAFSHVFIQNKLNYTPKVSVIVPVYNVEQYLPQCLDSILNQTLKEIEVICVDDGSTDNSLKILKEYAKKDNRITVITGSNVNAGHARNIGLKNARGKCISFVDSDDWLRTDAIQKLYEKMSANPDVDMCICKFDVFDNKKGCSIQTLGIQHKNIEKFNKDANGNLIITDNMPIFQICNPGPVNKLYRHDFLRNNKIVFQEIVSTNDVAFTNTAMALSKKIGVLDESLFYYRTNYGTSTTDKKDDNLFCFYDAILELRQRLKNAKVYDKFKSSFITAAVGYCLYNIEKVNNQNKNVLHTAVRDKIFPTLGITRETEKILLQDFYKVRFNQIFDLSKIPKVSVVLPIYNAEPYLRECLDSIVNQTLKDIEIICVNDGSTDNSLNIIKEYAARDIRIRYIDKPNAGYGQTMNSGIDLARGEYVGIVEPDDFIKLDMYETLYNKAKELNLDVIKADYCEFLGENKQYTYVNRKVFNGPDSFYNRVLTPIKDEKILYVFAINPAGIFKHSLLDKYKIRHNETPGAAYQDNGFWAQTTYLADKLYFMNRVFYCYRQDNPNQSIKKKNNVWTIPTEYHFIDNVFDKHKKIAKLRPLYFLRKYLSYIYHMTARLDVEYWYEYLTAAKNEFKKHEKKGDIEKEYFNASQWEDLQLIMNNPEDYIKKYTKDIKVSVIIPVYNTEKYLSQCLESVINQTLKDIEIICIDDCSVDNSVKILKEYADKDERITVVTNKINQKQGAARNKALEIAKGRYIQFVDSDDYLKPTAIEELYTYITKSSLDMLMFSGQNFKDGTNELVDNKYWNFTYLPAKWNKAVFSYKDCLGFLHCMAVSACLTMYKRGFIEKNNLRFPENVFFEDNVFFVKAITKCTACGILNKKLYCRRIHCESTTQTWNQHFDDYLKITEMVLGYLKDLKINKQTFDNYVDLHTNMLKNNFSRLELEDKKKYKKEVNKLLREYGRADTNFKAYLFFLYYLVSNVWMKLIILPFVKCKKHIKQILYSHSYRGKMDVLNAKFADVLRSVQSVKNDITQQIVQIKNQQNDLQKQQQTLVAQINNVVAGQNEYMNKKYSEVLKQITERGLGTQEKIIDVVNQLSVRVDNTNNDLLNEIRGNKSDVLKRLDVANNDLLNEVNKNKSDVLKYVDTANNDLLNKIHENKSEILKRVDEFDGLSDKIEAVKSDTLRQINMVSDKLYDTNNAVLGIGTDVEARLKHYSVLNAEPYWANVYHDTINNTNWLNNKSVSPGRWAVSYIVLYVLYRILDEVKPQSILECGLGQSSKLTIQYADAHNADLTICENNPDWLAFFQRQFPTADMYTKILDTEMIHVVPEYESRTYAGFKSLIGDKKFNLILIDGPLGSAHFSRPQILDVVDNLDKSFVILLDDMNRIGEQEIFNLLKKKLHEKHIEFKEGGYESDKRLGLICSPDLEWLTTM